MFLWFRNSDPHRPPGLGVSGLGGSRHSEEEADLGGWEAAEGSGSRRRWKLTPVGGLECQSESSEMESLEARPGGTGSATRTLLQADKSGRACRGRDRRVRIMEMGDCLLAGFILWWSKGWGDYWVLGLKTQKKLGVWGDSYQRTPWLLGQAE